MPETSPSGHVLITGGAGFIGSKVAELLLEQGHRVVEAVVRATWADITRARTLLGWEPRTALEDGIVALVDWYRANREWARDIGTVD